MNIAPVLRCRGTVRQIQPRLVPAVDATAPTYDEQGNLLRLGREAREAYTCHDIVLDTNPGGLVAVVVTPEASETTEGWLPNVGDELDLPVRGYVAWKGNPGRRFATPGYSLAADLFMAEKATPEGRRVSAVS